MELNMLMQITLSRRQMILWNKYDDIFLRNSEPRRLKDSWAKAEKSTQPA